MARRRPVPPPIDVEAPSAQLVSIGDYTEGLPLSLVRVDLMVRSCEFDAEKRGKCRLHAVLGMTFMLHGLMLVLKLGIPLASSRY